MRRDTQSCVEKAKSKGPGTVEGCDQAQASETSCDLKRLRRVVFFHLSSRLQRNVRHVKRTCQTLYVLGADGPRQPAIMVPTADLDNGNPQSPLSLSSLSPIRRSSQRLMSLDVAWPHFTITVAFCSIPTILVARSF